MKLKNILRRLILRTLVLFALLGAMAGLVLYIDDLNIEYSKKTAELQAQADAIVREMNTLRDQYSQIDSNAKLTKEIEEKIARKALTVNKNVLRDAFTQLRTKYYFGESKINLVANKPLEDPKYKSSTGNIESAGVSVDVQMMSDQDIFHMIDYLTHYFSGIKFTSVTFSSIRSLDAQALQETRQKGGVALIKGSVKFTWFGIKPVEDPAAAAAPEGAPVP